MAGLNTKFDASFFWFEFSALSFAGSLPHAWEINQASITPGDDVSTATIEFVDGFVARQQLTEDANKLRDRLQEFEGRYSPEIVGEIDGLLIKAVGLLARQSPDTATPAVDLADRFRDALARMPLVKATPVVADDRGRWLYERRQHQGYTWAALHAEYKLTRAVHGWPDAKVNGLRTAVERYATDNKLPLREGKAGRPITKK